ncbi:DUF2735 domain-containing protein [Alsobacter soli]|uniref:DUF2735 domain-containing protein n=1 Tax=Alsobacter soli TaxID=2109933 RepID=A0A2T1HPY9_9HYPH|nr:DUF2735 domain-containing protein [Alsobacter soli]PSC03579.1 DUF2735 domain-containing protein [Alsobacter soli]
MSAPRSRETAVILPFRNRAGSGVRAMPAAGQQPAPKEPPPIEFGSGWYHDAAIREADPERRR